MNLTLGDNHIEASLKYERLKEIISKALCCGEILPGDKLPSQNEMAEKYRVSPGTVREALASLVNDGLLYRIQGKGTFVAEKRNVPLTIALVIPHLHLDGDIEYSMGYNIVFPLIRFIEDEVRRCNADLLLYIDNDDIEQERENLHKVINRKVDGVIIYYIGYGRNEDYLRKLKDSGIPVVMIDRYVDNIDLNHVSTDNFAGAEHMVNLMIRKGFENIYHITNSSDCSAIRDRIAGYKSAMESNGLGSHVLPRWDPCPTNAGEEQAACNTVMDVVESESTPIGFFATNSLMIAGVWNAVKQTSVDTNKIALAFFDDEYVTFSDNTLVIKAVQPIEQIGRQAVNILLGKLKDNNSPCRVSLMPDIVVNEYNIMMNTEAILL
ncbi:MAG: GntR family transcriptional regulator [Armatimonadota bacterium]